MSGSSLYYGTAGDVDIHYDVELDDDPHMSLTSQTLNADGTPKRPMNAFMIFARKRRPEISAANQMMRTGDVSKILSKEWNAMSMSEKKFYLDQAKKLKDNFNSKYPDYVYRRRPNNSRKKRKSDAGHEAESPEYSPGVDKADPSIDEISPISSDELTIRSPVHAHHSQSQSPDHSIAFSSGTEGSVSPRSSLQYPHNIPSGVGRYEDALSYPDYPAAASPVTTYPSHTQHAHHLANSSWANRVEQSRPDWPSVPGLDSEATRQRISDACYPSDFRSEAYTSQLGQRSWSTVGQPISSTSAPAMTSRYANADFPTLTSAFTFDQPSSQRTSSMLSSPTSVPVTQHEYTSSMRMDRAHDQNDRRGDMYRGPTHSNTLPLPGNGHYVASPSAPYQWQQQNRSVPTTQSLQTGGTVLASSETAYLPQPGSNPHAYWDRGRFDAR